MFHAVAMAALRVGSCRRFDDIGEQRLRLAKDPTGALTNQEQVNLADPFI
jgi:hypothetical protein